VNTDLNGTSGQGFNATGIRPGWKVTVISKELSLPVLTGAAPSDRRENDKLIQRPRLHIIDDDSEYCQLMKCHLKNYFLVSVSTSGYEGYSRTMSQCPDLVILDYHMEGWDGVRTLQAIRANSRIRRTPVMMLTSDASRDVALKTLEAGANGFLRKDEATPELLLDRLNELLPSNQKLPLETKKSR